jgi:hypothetical protein
MQNTLGRIVLLRDINHVETPKLWAIGAKYSKIGLQKPFWGRRL